MRTERIVTALACLAAASCMPEYKFTDEAAMKATPTDAGSTDAPVDAPPAEGTCRTNLDCVASPAGAWCSPLTNKCVQCVNSDQCATNTWCSQGACVPGCRFDSDCAPGAGEDAGTTPAVAKCDTELHMCRGCRFDDECPAGFLCAPDGLGTCVPGCTTAHACAAGQECCGSQCFDTQTSIANCGSCGNACPTPEHSTMKCDKGTCRVATCDTGFATCNTGEGADLDGCETNTATSVDHCGGCGTACTVSNGTGSCASGSCKLTSCNAGYANCDGNAGNGCEQPLTSELHCGGCNAKCTVVNGTGSCATGTCAVGSCNAGYADCDGDPRECETVGGGVVNSCATAEAVLDTTASTDVCGTNDAESVTVTTTKSKFFKVHLVRCDHATCSKLDPMRARFTLTSPSGVAYELRVFKDSTCGTLVGTAATGATEGTATVTFTETTWTSTACYESRDLWVEVNYVSGAACAPASLAITGAY